MKYLLPFTALLLSACGGAYEVKVSDVNVKHSLSFTEVEAVFRKKCLSDNPHYTPEQADSCTNDSLAEFIKFIGGK